MFTHPRERARFNGCLPFFIDEIDDKKPRHLRARVLADYERLGFCANFLRRSAAIQLASVICARAL